VVSPSAQPLKAKLTLSVGGGRLGGLLFHARKNVQRDRQAFQRTATGGAAHHLAFNDPLSLSEYVDWSQTKNKNQDYR
jgi:hypothetical protein